MALSPKTSIDNFLNQPHIALAGYSTNSKKFGHTVYKTLQEKGYQLYPVNPKGGSTPEGDTIYPSIAALPTQVKALIVLTQPSVTEQVVDTALGREMEHIWIQQMSGSKELYSKLQELDINAICGRCILLHARPEGIHKLHRTILGLFGRLPR